MSGLISQPAMSACRVGSVEIDADVLVIGGGPAGAWAACAASGKGAKVVLVDKGYCGTSGATAAAGTGVWYVPPDAHARETAMASRERLGGYLADRSWMTRVLDRTYEQINQLAEWGYPFPTDDAGESRRNSLQGPEYMRLMRRKVKQAQVTILDHCPALELLVDGAGAAAGAAGVRRQKGDTWLVRARAVVLASGGCAFQSKTLGGDVLTGDGYLMAAEVGAELTGMEFSNAYAISAAFASVTKTLFYRWGTFYYADGSPIPGAGSQFGRGVIAKTLLTQPVYCQLDKADEQTQVAMRLAQPNFFLPMDRAGINPFRQRFPVTLRLEGTVRGTGGLRIVDQSCTTTVAGLYAAGDAATRELICGGFTGGGSHNAAWAMSSGYWAGVGAAEFAQQVHPATRRDRDVRPAGGAALRSGGRAEFDPAEARRAVQAEVFPYQRNYFRSAAGLGESLESLDDLWRSIRSSAASSFANIVKAREAAAMAATARWMYRSALARSETRGMHKREDYTQQDPHQRHYFTCDGLDEVRVTTRAAPELPQQEIAA